MNKIFIFIMVVLASTMLGFTIRSAIIYEKDSFTCEHEVTPRGNNYEVSCFKVRK